MKLFWLGDKLPELPFNIQLGSFVQLSQMSFALSEEELVTEFPGEQHQIKNISLLESDEIRLVRFYLTDLKEAEEIHYIEIALDTDNPKDILHIRYFRMDGWLTPDSEDWFEEELPVWTDEEEGLIGAVDFNIENDRGNFTYDRLWFSEDEGNVGPVIIEEKLYIDSAKRPDSEIKNECMLYARSVGQDIQEYVYLTHYEGGPLEEGVLIFTGIELNEMDVKFL